MKSSEFKKVIKSAVKEAVREELKDILFEAFKSNTSKPSITENHTYVPPNNTSTLNPTQTGMTLEDKRDAYKNILGETAASFTSNNVPQSFTPQPGMGGAEGNLGTGNVSMDQISGLLNKQ